MDDTPPAVDGEGLDALLSLAEVDLRSGRAGDALGELARTLGAVLGDAPVGIDRIGVNRELLPLARGEGAPADPPAAAQDVAAAGATGPLARDGWLATPVQGTVETEAVLWVRVPEEGLPPAGERMLRVAVARAEWLLENARLRDDLERAMAQVLEDDERMLGRMGLDIHDGPTQQLSVALLEVQLLDAELADSERQGGELPPPLRPALSRIYETLGGALHEMRELIGHLRPAQFQDRGLDEILGDAITAFEARSDTPVERVFVGEFPVNGVSVTQRITFYRILQEALANAHRHGRAGTVTVEVTSDESGTKLVVSDDGGGFDPGTIQRERERTPRARYGLRGMRDRARILGGSFQVESAPGRGTVVTVFLPRWRPPGALGEITG